MLNFEEKVDEFCTKLVNGEIQVSEIPDALFVAVLKRAIYDLPAPTMEAAVERLNSTVDRLRGEISQKEELLAQKRRELDELEQKTQQLDNTQLIEED